MTKRKAHVFENGKELKECSRCKRLQPLDCFHKDNSKWDGLHGFCKECTKTENHNTYIKNPEKIYESVYQYQKRTGLLAKYKPYNPLYYSSAKSRAKKRARDLNRRLLKRKADAKNTITNEMIQSLLEKYNYQCAYCGTDCSLYYEIEHKIPLCRGGDNSFENLAIACKHCNCSKHSKTDVEFCGRKIM